MIFAYQPFSLKMLHLSPNQISLLFTLFGIVGLLTLLLLLQKIVSVLGLKTALSLGLFIIAIVFFSVLKRGVKKESAF